MFPLVRTRAEAVNEPTPWMKLQYMETVYLFTFVLDMRMFPFPRG